MADILDSDDILKKLTDEVDKVITSDLYREIQVRMDIAANAVKASQESTNTKAKETFENISRDLGQQVASLSEQLSAKYEILNSGMFEIIVELENLVKQEEGIIKSITSKQQDLADAMQSGDVEAQTKATNRINQLQGLLEKRQAQINEVMDARDAALGSYLMKQKKKAEEDAGRKVKSFASIFGADELISDEYLNNLRERARDFKDVLVGMAKDPRTGLVAVSALIAKGITIAVEQIQEAYKVLRREGFDFDTSFKKSVKGFKESVGLLKEGVLASTEFILEGRTAASRQLGRKLTEEEAQDFTKLTKSFGQGAEFFGTIAELKRLTGSFDTAQRELLAAQLVGEHTQIPPVELARAMVEEAEVYVTTIGKAPGTFAAMVANAKQLGIELSKAQGFADNMMTNFEGWLESQAQLQAFFPGLDFSEVEFASAFGTESDVADALSKALKQTGVGNISELSRSAQLALTKATGFSREEIQRALTGEVKKEAEVPGAIEIKSATEKLDKFGTNLLRSAADLVASFGGLGETVGRVTGLLNLWLTTRLLTGVGRLGAGAAGLGGAATGTTAAAGGAAGMFSKLPRVAPIAGGLLTSAFAYGNYRDRGFTKAESVAGAGTMGLGATLGSLALGNLARMGAGKFIGGALGSVAGPIGTVIGSIAGGFIADKLFRAVVKPGEEKPKEETTITTQQARPRETSELIKAMRETLDTSKVERKLDELIYATKQSRGMTIELDGKKVGYALSDSTRRGVTY